MAAFDYEDAIATAQELIEEFGRAVTLEKLLNLPKDEAKPWRASGTDGPTVESTFDTVAAFVPVSGNDLGDIVRDKDLLKRADQVLLVPGTEEDLAAFNSVLDSVGEQRWKIEWVQVLRPGPLVVLFAIGVTR